MAEERKEHHAHRGNTNTPAYGDWLRKTHKHNPMQQSIFMAASVSDTHLTISVSPPAKKLSGAYNVGHDRLSDNRALSETLPPVHG